MTANNQATEDLKEQMELKRLYANCDQVIHHSKAFYQRYVDDKHITAIERERPTLRWLCAFISGSGVCISASEAEPNVVGVSRGGSSPPPPHSARK